MRATNHDVRNMLSEDGMTVNSPRIWQFLKSTPLGFHVFIAVAVWPSWYRPFLRTFLAYKLDELGISKPCNVYVGIIDIKETRRYHTSHSLVTTEITFSRRSVERPKLAIVECYFVARLGVFTHRSVECSCHVHSTRRHRYTDTHAQYQQ